MSQPTQARAPSRALDPGEYRPVSGLAIASVLIAGLYAVLIVVGALVAFFTATPLFLPPWTLIFPVAGAALSWVAWLQIRQAEGTLAGIALTKWSWALSILFGLTYVAYVSATYFVLRQKATAFTEQWFDLLRQGKTDPVKVDAAFLLTQEPRTRQGQRAADTAWLEKRFDAVQAEEMESRGPLTRFRESFLVGFLRQGGADTKIKPLGVAHWEFLSGSYRVRLNYRIEGPEGTVDALITVHSGESPDRDSKDPPWFVVWNETNSGVRQTKPTPLGETLVGLRKNGQEFMTRWMMKLEQGDLEDAFLDTLPPTDRTRPARDHKLHVAMAGLATGSAPVQTVPGLALGVAFLDQEQARRLCLPGYYEFLAGGLLLANNFRSQTEDMKKEILALTRGVFRRRQPVLMQLQEASATPWTIEQDRLLRLPQDFQLSLTDLFTGSTKFQCHGTAVLESSSPEVVHKLRQLLEAGGKGPSPTAEGSGALPAGADLGWRLLALELKRGGPPPRGPMMPD